jgi:hypothetical protein
MVMWALTVVYVYGFHRGWELQLLTAVALLVTFWPATGARPARR